ncbi:hypothetical protein EsH8_I_000417 [Colletotrichum jinshuiense]
MSASLAPECNEVKERYDTCFLKWYSEKYLRGTGTDNNECADLFKNYQKCLTVALKERGIDKLLDEAREDSKDNDATYLGRKLYPNARAHHRVQLPHWRRGPSLAQRPMPTSRSTPSVDATRRRGISLAADQAALQRTGGAAPDPASNNYIANSQICHASANEACPLPFLALAHAHAHACFCHRQRAINTAVVQPPPRRSTRPSRRFPVTPSSSVPPSSIAPKDTSSQACDPAHDPRSSPQLPSAPPSSTPAPVPQIAVAAPGTTPSIPSSVPIVPQTSWRQASACTAQGNSDSMHPLSVLSLGIFVAGYITARWDLVTRLYELVIFAWNYGVVTRAAKGFALLTFVFLLIFIPVERLATREANLHPRSPGAGVSAREQLRRRGSF